MKKFYASLLSFIIMMPMLAFAFSSAQAAIAVDSATNNLLWNNKAGDIQTQSGLQSADPRDTIAKVIKVILGFLGIIAVVIILAGGFKWMTSQGEEGKIEEATNMIKAGVIGLVIILSAYGIAVFVTNTAYNVTSN